MSSPPQPEKHPSNSHQPVLDRFIQRLVGAISQSSLLEIRPSRSGRLLDCCSLNSVQPSLADDVLQAVIEELKPIGVQLDLRSPKERKGQRETATPLFAGEEQEEHISDRAAQEHARIYKALERMSRDAELVKRETGRHALWLGYPLLYAVAPESDILAPVFLWPIHIRLDLRRRGRAYIGRDGAISPQFNRAMSAWV
jgi:hypothetical protein